MPKEKNLIKCIPKIYKRNFENMGLFFFVEAQKQIVPAITVAQAINNFYRFINEEYDSEIAQVSFSRMRSEYIEKNYNEFCDDKD